MKKQSTESKVLSIFLSLEGIPCAKILRIMKLTIVLLIVACLQISAAGYSQHITLSEKNVTFQKLFHEIRKQSGYNFLYNDAWLNKSTRISVALKDASLEEALNACFKDQSLSFSIVDKTIVVKRISVVSPTILPEMILADPPIIITGKVTSRKGETLPSVSILIKGSGKGVLSDVNGNFRIQVSPTDKALTFSFIGMKKQEVLINGRKVINVVMEEELSSLQQVIVTGYYNQKKESFTGNAITVSGEDLRRIGTQNLLQNIQVIDPSFKQVVSNEFGSDPNRLPEFQVRGTTALGASTSSNLDPLDKRTLTQNNPNLPTFILDGYQVSLEKVYDLDINRV